MFAILVKGGSAYALQLAPSQGRLENVGCIYGATGGTSPHQHMSLVDEEDALALLYLLDYFLEPLLKLPSIDGASYQRTHIQHHHPFVPQTLWHSVGRDQLG